MRGVFFQMVFREIMNLRPDSTFIDFGHGIGNTCLQAAYTIGCESKGIELVDARYFASEAMRRGMAKVVNINRQTAVSSQYRLIGVISSFSHCGTVSQVGLQGRTVRVKAWED